jgi:hypothetical protein
MIVVQKTPLMAPVWQEFSLTVFKLDDIEGTAPPSRDSNFQEGISSDLARKETFRSRRE